MLAQDVERSRVAVIHHQHIVHRGLRHTWSDWTGAKHSIQGLRTRQYLIEDAVVIAGEHGDLIAAGYGARSAKRGDHCFRARVAKSRSFHARHPADQLSDLSGQRRLGADLKALFQLLAHSADHKIRTGAEQNATEAVCHVDIFISVNIPES